MARGRSRRIVTVWYPDWPVKAAAVPADIPAVVVHANRVVARTRVAAAEGVVLGQRRREAQRRCPDAVILVHEPDRDARAFESVVHEVGHFTPRLEIVEPGWLCLDARGPSRYHGGDHRLARQLIAALTHTNNDNDTGTRVQVGVADGRFPSAVAARQARDEPIVVPPGQSPAYVAPLPVSWLHLVGELDADVVGLFARMGLHKLGDLAALPAADLHARFGPAGLHAHHLASGTDERPADAREATPVRRVEHRFDDPIIQLDTLVFTAKSLADQLAGQLASYGQVCTRLVVTAETDHQERSERAWYRAAGLSAAAMVDRARWQLSSWTAAGDLTAGVVVLRFHAEESRADDGEQVGLWGGASAADERARRAVARLAGMVGDHAVLVPAWRGGHLPADRYRWIPAATTDLTDSEETVERLRPPPRDNDHRTGPWPGALPSPSPVIVPADLQPAILADSHGQPVQVSGRGELTTSPATLIIGEQPTQAVTGWAGPWPLDEQWWDTRGRRRAARLQVLTDDGAAHLVIAEHQRWWVAATYA